MEKASYRYVMKRNAPITQLTSLQVTGQEWARHRRIAAAPFNERMNRIVWDEASRQTRQMSDHWDSFGEKGFSSTLEDINTVTLNVFAKASLGRSWDYCNAYDCARRAEIEGDFDESSHRKLKWTYRDSLFFVTHNIVTYAMIPEWILCAPAWSLPPPLKRFVSAWNDLGDYFQLALRTTKQQLASGEAEQHSSVISYLVTKSAEVRREDLKEKSNRDQGLSDTDIYGTLFALNQTGHDTSKSVLGSTLYLLAAYPEVQQWLRSEIVSVDSAMVTVGGTSGGRIYENTFHQLRRFLAVMVPYILTRKIRLGRELIKIVRMKRFDYTRRFQWSTGLRSALGGRTWPLLEGLCMSLRTLW